MFDSHLVITLVVAARTPFWSRLCTRDLYWTGCPLLPIPGDFDATIGISLENPRAICGVHCHTLPLRDKTDNFITGQRAAALGKTHQDILQTLNLDRVDRFFANFTEDLTETTRFGCFGLELFRDKPRQHLVAGHLAVADSCLQIFNRTETEP